MHSDAFWLSLLLEFNSLPESIKDRVFWIDFCFNYSQYIIEIFLADIIADYGQRPRDDALLLVQLVLEKVVARPLTYPLFVSVDLLAQSEPFRVLLIIDQSHLGSQTINFTIGVAQIFIVLLLDFAPLPLFDISFELEYSGLALYLFSGRLLFLLDEPYRLRDY